MELTQWLILNGAIDDVLVPGQIDPFRARACCAATVRASMRITGQTTVTITQAKNALAKAKPILMNLTNDLLMQTDAFHAFLLGTLPTPNFSEEELKNLLVKKLGSEGAASIVIEEIKANGKGRALWDQLQSDIGRPESSNSCLLAYPGILERISAYVGILKSKTKLSRLRTFHVIALHLTISNLPDHCFEFS